MQSLNYRISMVLVNQFTIFGTGFDKSQSNFLEFMKTTLLITGLFLSSMALAWQDDALIRFQVSYSEDYRLSVGNLESGLEDMEAEGQGRDRVVETFIGEMHRIFDKEYAAKLGLDSKMLAGYPEQLVFDPYGFPQARAKRAAKFMDARRYYAVEILMEAANGIITSESTEGALSIKELAIKGDKKKFKPRIEVRFITYNAEGKRIKGYNVAGKAKKKIVLKGSAFLRLIPVGESKTLEDSQEVILNAYRKALDKLVSKVS